MKVYLQSSHEIVQIATLVRSSQKVVKSPEVYIPVIVFAEGFVLIVIPYDLLTLNSQIPVLVYLPFP